MTFILSNLLQSDKETLTLIVSLISVSVAFLATILSVIVSLWNVNRQRNASLKNDEEKFKRDLNLRTCEEFLDKIFAVKSLFQNTRTLKDQLEWTIKGTKSFEDFNDALWKIIEDKSLQDFWLYYLKREIVLHSYKDDIEKIYEDWDKATQTIWKFKLFWVPGRTDQELIREISEINARAEPIIELITNLQRKIQNDFLGKIYQKVI